MLIRKIKTDLKSKNFIIIITIMFLILIISFLQFKNYFFYSTFKYFPDSYLYQYVEEYLEGNIHDLIVNNAFLIYLDPSLVNIQSALYLYAIVLGTHLCSFAYYILPFIIFSKIAKNLYSEIYNKYSISNIIRIGKRKYFNQTIIKNGIISGLIFVIPKLLFLLLLLIFFPTGSSSYMLDIPLGLGEFFKYNQSNPYLMLIADFVISFLYGFFISSLSIIIISLLNNKPLSYIVFIFSILLISIIPTLFGKVALIFYYSIYACAFYSQNFNMSSTILTMLSLTVIITIISRVIYKRKVEDNI